MHINNSRQNMDFIKVIIKSSPTHKPNPSTNSTNGTNFVHFFIKPPSGGSNSKFGNFTRICFAKVCSSTITV